MAYLDRFALPEIAKRYTAIYREKLSFEIEKIEKEYKSLGVRIGAIAGAALIVLLEVFGVLDFGLLASLGWVAGGAVAGLVAGFFIAMKFCERILIKHYGERCCEVLLSEVSLKSQNNSSDEMLVNYTSYSNDYVSLAKKWLGLYLRTLQKRINIFVITAWVLAALAVIAVFVVVGMIKILPLWAGFASLIIPACVFFTLEDIIDSKYGRISVKLQYLKLGVIGNVAINPVNLAKDQQKIESDCNNSIESESVAAIEDSSKEEPAVVEEQVAAEESVNENETIAVAEEQIVVEESVQPEAVAAAENTQTAVAAEETVEIQDSSVNPELQQNENPDASQQPEIEQKKEFV